MGLRIACLLLLEQCSQHLLSVLFRLEYDAVIYEDTIAAYILIKFGEQEYLMQTVGPVKRAEIAYGPNGESRGAATVIFVHLDSATKAAKVLKDVLLDKRPLKVYCYLS